ncbi:MAG: efflux RND transporter permease subunit [Myxococcales bacterium]|nr:efflux RND transporter permease subunit [Myxococcales bacterium]
MQWLAELCVKRPVFATVLSLVILVVGGVFYRQLGVDQFPKIDFPAVVVVTVLPGAAPEDIETDISDKIEGAVNTISGIDELRSTSSEGISTVAVQFLLEKDINVAAAEVQQKINAVLPELPKGIDPPVVQKFDPDAQPVLYIALRAPGQDVKDVTDVADRIVRRRLESVSGVGQVTLLGARKRQINLLVDPVKLKALGITPAEVGAAVNAQNITLPGGRLDTSRDYLTLRVNGRVKTLDEMRAIVIRNTQGREVRLDELAIVEDGVEDVASAARWNGESTVLLALRKQSGTNTVTVVDAVLGKKAKPLFGSLGGPLMGGIDGRLDEVRKELPKGYSLEVQRDGSAVIRTGTEAVTEHLILGALFAAIIVLIFLGNVRSTIIAALAIPTSIIGTFALMKLMDFTLNTITLLALALAVGIVIDDAIVVLENIFKYVEEKGYTPKQAAVAGTREIGLAVLATTLSLIAVFLPIAFISGIPGRFLRSFGVTMSFAIAVSLFVSFTLTPMLAASWLEQKKKGDHRKSMLERLVDVGYRPVERGYGAVLGFVLRHRWIVLIASVLSLASMGPLTKAARKGFLPIDDRAQFEVVVRLPEGRSVASSELIGERVARQIRELPEVTATLVTVGDDAARTANLARIYVKLLPPDARTITQNELKGVVREKIISQLPKDLRVTVADVNEFGGGQATARIQYLLAGPDLKLLTASNERVLEKLRKIPDAVDVDSSLIVGKPELGVTIDRERAADLGVQVADVAQALQLLIAGQKVSSFAEGGEQYDVRLRALPEYRSNEDLLQLITVPSRKVGLVSLSDVVRLEPGTSPAAILRFQRERQVTFLVNGKPGANEGAIGDLVMATLEEEVKSLPRGFTARPQGQTKIMKEVGQSFLLGLLASMVFMYLILAAQFESWLHPVTILISLPLTLPYAILSIILFDQALDLYSGLGIFVLFGVVKKNAILQIDHTNQLREAGKTLLAAAGRIVDRGQAWALTQSALHELLDDELTPAELDRALAKADPLKPASIKRQIEKAWRYKSILKGNKDRLRPILMTTLAFVAGMIPLVTSKGIGAGYNKATAGVVVGGQSLSLVLTLLAVPVVYSYFDDIVLFFKKYGATDTTVELSTADTDEHPSPVSGEVSK